ncbi:MAG: DNA repair protein RadA, partial [Rhodospirillales bacterium]|nr:DNA repair protein RadA [Rhodospirillales bacterium]
MARASSHFVCQECGAATAKWAGSCPSCGAWNTLVEEAIAPPAGGVRGAAKPARAGGRRL